MTAAGFALTVRIFYPGVMNYDSRYIHEYAMHGQYGDWQSPAMMAMWALINPLDPGAGSMFLLIASVYWLAIAVLALTIARGSVWRAVVLVLLTLSPPAFLFVGMIWRDVLFAGLWLAAAALALAVSEHPAKMRVPVQALAVGLLALGFLLRPNAIAAAPILGTLLLWPAQFSWKRAVVIFVPVAVALFAFVHIVFYGVLGATRENPLHSILVYDLGGITHFTKQNQFPVSWNARETTLLTERCYEPVEWNVYWTSKPCQFVMERLEVEKIFGSPTLVSAWWRAVTAHPLAYLQHRAAFMWNFLAGTNQTIWIQDLDDPSRTVFSDRPVFAALAAVNNLLVATPLLRAGTWLVLCTAVCAFGWRRRDTPAGAFAVGVGGSAMVYMLTFAVLGVASDFRYAYWAVLAGLAGAVVIWPASRAGRRLLPAAHRPS